MSGIAHLYTITSQLCSFDTTFLAPAEWTSAWDGFLSKNTSGTSCLGPLAGLQAQQKLYADTVTALGDPKKALADRGFPVHLSTTDPAAHIAASLNGAASNLTVGRIDPKAETATYTEEVLAAAGKDLDAQGKRMLEEDLREVLVHRPADP